MRRVLLGLLVSRILVGSVLLGRLHATLCSNMHRDGADSNRRCVELEDLVTSDGDSKGSAAYNGSNGNCSAATAMRIDALILHEQSRVDTL
jgi:hypothetical protein